MQLSQIRAKYHRLQMVKTEVHGPDSLQLNEEHLH